MNLEDTAFVTYRRRKGRYTEDWEFEEIKLEDTDSDMDPTGIHSDRGKRTGEDEDRMEFQSLVNALNDLAKGQKEMLHAINRLVIKPEQDWNDLQVPSRDRVSTSNNGRHRYTNMHNTPHIYNEPSRLTMPQFLENPIAGLIIPTEPSEPFGAYLQE